MSSPRMNVAVNVPGGPKNFPITVAKIQAKAKETLWPNSMTWEGAKSYFTTKELEPRLGNMEGFAWQPEGFRVTPTCPFENAGPNPIGFKITNNIHIPEVRILEDSESKVAQFKEFEYKLYGYHGTPTASAQVLDTDSCFVYIADTEALGTGLPSHIFMRFKDLKERLCGEYERRLELYALDWLVGVTLRISKDTDFPLTLDLDKAEDDKIHRNTASDIVKTMDSKKFRSHLPIWDQDGTLLPWSESAKILGAFLQASLDPNDKALAKEPMPALYFRNLCRLVVAAATSPRSSFAVMARFWSHVVQDQDMIILRYSIPTSGSAWGNGMDDIRKAFWERIIKSAHTEVVGGLSLAKVKNPMIFVPSDKCIVNTKIDVRQPRNAGDEYIWIGSHPQGLYDLSVRETDLHRMTDTGKFRPGCENTPTTTAIKKWKPLIKDDGPAKTITAITKDKLDQASIWPRKCDQNSLMGTEANTVAEDLYGRANPSKRGMAEWLHRSAYSYGGLNKEGGPLNPIGGPDTSQHPSNLVIGTYAANTHMIRYEEYLKRLVKKTNHTAILETSLAYQDLKYGEKEYKWPYPMDSKDNSCWIAPALDYIWHVCSPDFTTKGCSGAVRFWLFSCNVPMRFEAMMDRMLDEKLYKLYGGNETDSENATLILNALWKEGYSTFSSFV